MRQKLCSLLDRCTRAHKALCGNLVLAYSLCVCVCVSLFLSSAHFVSMIFLLKKMHPLMLTVDSVVLKPK